MKFPVDTAQPAPPALLDDTALGRTELTRQFGIAIARGIKQVGMYRHNDSRFAEFLTPAWEVLTRLVETSGTFLLRVEAENLVADGTPVLPPGVALAYPFFRDGIRQLIFRRGFPLDEMVQLTLIALSDTDRPRKDTVAQLWHAGLTHLEYVAVEGFSVEGVDDKQVEVEVTKVVDYLYTRLRSDSNDSLRFARVSASDLDAKFSHVEQLRGLVIQSAPALDRFKAKLQGELDEEYAHRLMPKLVDAVFQVIESGLRDEALIVEVLTQLLDALLIQEDFPAINQLAKRVHQLGELDLSGALDQVHTEFIGKMGEEQRVSRIGDLLGTGPPKDSVALADYLRSLHPKSLFALLAVLESVDIADNRQLICDALVPFCTKTPDPFFARLESDRPQTVRDMVYILETAKVPLRHQRFAVVLGHPSLAMRLEVLGILAKGKDTASVPLLIKCLQQDPAQQVRAMAARMLVTLSPDNAYAELMALVRSDTFDVKAMEERIEVFSALGTTGHPGVLSFFAQLMGARITFLGKKRTLEDRLLAIHGLVAMRSIQAHQMLQYVAEDITQPDDIRSAAQRGASATRRLLFGDATAPGGPP
ncbi:MAG: HEAT repeat domain-containing protein [Myxococcaceae bacterium]